MKLYFKLSKIGFLKENYAHKFLFVTFIGIHIPLIGLLLFILFGKENASSNSILFFILIMTLLASAITLLVLKKLISPIVLASKALDEYRNNRTIPQLPILFEDEAGLLLKNIQNSISDNENYRTEKEDLIYLLSHDLRNFNGSIQSLAQLVLEEKPSETIIEYADLICQITNKQFYFIQTVINLIKEEDKISKKILSVNNVQFVKLFQLVLNQVDHKLEAKKIQLKSELKIESAIIKIDDDLLVQVLVNLVDNAIKFSHADSEIAVGVYQENNKIIINVSDSGIGFNSNYKHELFKKFTSQGRVGTADEPSTGIGLYLCKKIIEKHGGELRADSQGVDKGAVFSVIF